MTHQRDLDAVDRGFKQTGFHQHCGRKSLELGLPGAGSGTAKSLNLMGKLDVAGGARITAVP